MGVDVGLPPRWLITTQAGVTLERQAAGGPPQLFALVNSTRKFDVDLADDPRVVAKQTAMTFVVHAVDR